MSKLIKTYPITFTEMDMDYQLTSSGVLNFLQDGIADLMTRRRMAAFDILDEDFLWVISDFHVVIDKERPLWPEVITLEVWVSNLTSIKAYFDFRMLDSRGQEFARGTTIWAIIDALTRRPSLRAEQLLKDKFVVVDELALGEHARPKFKSKGAQLGKVDYRTLMPDVDFNAHVSNRLYLNTALSSEDLYFERTHCVREVLIHYYKETMLGQMMHCFKHQALDADPLTRIYEILNEDGQLTCMIQISWQEQEMRPLAVRDNAKRDV